MLAYDCPQLFESRIYPAQPKSLGIHPQAEGGDLASLFSGDSIEQYLTRQPCMLTSLRGYFSALPQKPRLSKG